MTTKSISIMIIIIGLAYMAVDGWLLSRIMLK
jgi:hypothetical protein